MSILLYETICLTAGEDIGIWVKREAMPIEWVDKSFFSGTTMRAKFYKRGAGT
jgi:hypothetical protein